MSGKSHLHRKESRRLASLVYKYQSKPVICFACFQVALQQICQMYEGKVYKPNKHCWKHQRFS